MNIQAVEGEEVLQGSALTMVFSLVNPFLLKCGLRLKIPDIIWKAGHDVALSVHQIAAQLPSDAPDLDALSRILTYLSTMGILRAINATEEISAPMNRKYALTSVTKTYFISEDINYARIYDGFKDVNTLVDLGGGHGEALSLIIDAYPHIRAINFDLPQVIETAPTLPGVQHISGSLFETAAPSADAIFIKNFLHIWGDEDCMKLLNNCYQAVPEKGKLIIAEAVLDLTEDSDMMGSANVLDALMLNLSPGGRERTRKQWNELLKAAGFSLSKIVGRKGNLTKVIEAIKS